MIARVGRIIVAVVLASAKECGAEVETVMAREGLQQWDLDCGQKFNQQTTQSDTLLRIRLGIRLSGMEFGDLLS